MTSDLSLDPIAAAQLYCRRVTIETMFDTLKNTLGAIRRRRTTFGRTISGRHHGIPRRIKININARQIPHAPETLLPRSKSL